VVGGALLASPLVLMFAVLAVRAVLLWQAMAVARADVAYAALAAAGAAASPGAALQGGMGLDQTTAERVFAAALADRWAPARVAVGMPRVAAVRVLAAGSTAPDGRTVPAPALWVDVEVPVALGSLGGRPLGLWLPVRGLAYAPAYPGVVP
jgi:hypothetical protein